MITRRTALRGALALGAAGLSIGGYALLEPWRLHVARYRVRPPGWPGGLKLRLAVLSDIHACEPWMPVSRIARIVARTNSLAADCVLLLGDFIGGHRLVKRSIPKAEWTSVLADLSAPLGVHAILGNHDWWEDIDVQRRRQGPPPVRLALEAAGIPVYDNDALRLAKDGQPFWIAGLGDQWAFFLGRRRGRHGDRFGYQGVDDLPGTMARITDDAPVVLMIHEPDMFPDVPERVALTLAGHTHGGQIAIAGYAPVVPSKFGVRYRHGHVVEDGRNLIVSGGLGCSGFPVRFGVPPEIVLVEIAA